MLRLIIHIFICFQFNNFIFTYISSLYLMAGSGLIKILYPYLLHPTFSREKGEWEGRVWRVMGAWEVSIVWSSLQIGQSSHNMQSLQGFRDWTLNKRIFSLTPILFEFESYPFNFLCDEASRGPLDAWGGATK